LEGLGRRLASGVGVLTSVWVRHVARTATLRVVGAEGSVDADRTCAPFTRALLDDAARGHAIVSFWSADQVAIALLAAERFGLRPALERYEVVADDSFGGEMMHALGHRLGLRMRLIHASGARRLADVGAWIRNPGPFFIAVDGGTTYGTVPTGMVRLAARLRSRVWPVAVRARHAARVPGLVAHVPMPATSVVLAVGAPMLVERTMPVAEVAGELTHRLDATTALAEASLYGRLASRDYETERWRRTV